MKCRYCNTALASLRSLTDGEFCCDEHRSAFESRGPAMAGDRGAAEPLVGKAKADFARRNLNEPPAIGPQISAFDFQPPAPRASGEAAHASNAGLPASPELSSAAAGLEPAAVEGFSAFHAQPEAHFSSEAPLTGEPGAAPRERNSGTDSEPNFQSSGGAPTHPSHEVLGSWRWLHAAWDKAPRDLKIVMLILPVLVALAVGPVPKVKVQVSSNTANNVQHIVVSQLKDIQQTISSRAAVAFYDDFRSGLDSWQSRSNLTRSWSYDASGFVRPGPLAIYKPTTELSDYRFEFLEEIDQKALGCAFRAADLDNYYAVKLVVVRPGPLPMVHLVRYAVIKGKEISRVEKPLPFTTRPDTLYRVLVDVRGSDFTIMVQGQVVDFWSDYRLHQGGVGFFCQRGETARLRWVEVSHQYDALGRLCAYLAPYGIEGKDLN